MAKRIQNIVQEVNFYLGKAESGYHSPDIITRELNVESLNVFRDLIKEYAITRQYAEYIEPFLNTTPATTIPANGLFPKPTGFEHADGIYLEDGTEVEMLTTDKFIPRIKHPNKAPSNDYPICRKYRNNIQFLPKDPGQKVIISYFKLPTKAVYAFSTSGDAFIYDDDASVDWEWTDQLSDIIVNRTLANFGVPLKDGQLIEVSQLEKSQE